MSRGYATASAVMFLLCIFDARLSFAQVENSSLPAKIKDKAIATGTLAAVGELVRKDSIHQRNSRIIEKIMDESGTNDVNKNYRSLISFAINSSVPIPVNKEKDNFIIFYNPLIGVSVIVNFIIDGNKIDASSSKIIPNEKITTDDNFNYSPPWAISEDIPKVIKENVTRTFDLVREVDEENIKILRSVSEHQPDRNDIYVSFYRIGLSMISLTSDNVKCGKRINDRAESLVELVKIAERTNIDLSSLRENVDVKLNIISGRRYSDRELFLYSMNGNPFTYIAVVSNPSANCHIQLLEAIDASPLE